MFHLIASPAKSTKSETVLKPRVAPGATIDTEPIGVELGPVDIQRNDMEFQTHLPAAPWNHVFEQEPHPRSGTVAYSIEAETPIGVDLGPDVQNESNGEVVPIRDFEFQSSHAAPWESIFQDRPKQGVINSITTARKFKASVHKARASKMTVAGSEPPATKIETATTKGREKSSPHSNLLTGKIVKVRENESNAKQVVAKRAEKWGGTAVISRNKERTTVGRFREPQDRNVQSVEIPIGGSPSHTAAASPKHRPEKKAKVAPKTHAPEMKPQNPDARPLNISQSPARGEERKRKREPSDPGDDVAGVDSHPKNERQRKRSLETKRRKKKKKAKGSKKTELSQLDMHLTVVVRGLPGDITQEELHTFLEERGVVKDVTFIRCNPQHRSWWLNFVSKESRDKALEMSGKEHLKGIPLVIEPWIEKKVPMWEKKGKRRDLTSSPRQGERPKMQEREYSVDLYVCGSQNSSITPFQIQRFFYSNAKIEDVIGVSIVPEYRVAGGTLQSQIRFGSVRSFYESLKLSGKRLGPGVVMIRDASAWPGRKATFDPMVDVAPNEFAPTGPQKIEDPNDEAGEMHPSLESCVDGGFGNRKKDDLLKSPTGRNETNIGLSPHQAVKVLRNVEIEQLQKQEAEDGSEDAAESRVAIQRSKLADDCDGVCREVRNPVADKLHTTDHNLDSTEHQNASKSFDKVTSKLTVDRVAGFCSGSKKEEPEDPVNKVENQENAPVQAELQDVPQSECRPCQPLDRAIETLVENRQMAQEGNSNMDMENHDRYTRSDEVKNQAFSQEHEALRHILATHTSGDSDRDSNVIVIESDDEDCLSGQKNPPCDVVSRDSPQIGTAGKHIFDTYGRHQISGHGLSKLVAQTTTGGITSTSSFALGPDADKMNDTSSGPPAGAQKLVGSASARRDEFSASHQKEQLLGCKASPDSSDRSKLASETRCSDDGSKHVGSNEAKINSFLEQVHGFQSQERKPSEGNGHSAFESSRVKGPAPEVKIQEELQAESEDEIEVIEIPPTKPSALHDSSDDEVEIIEKPTTTTKRTNSINQKSEAGKTTYSEPTRQKQPTHTRIRPQPERRYVFHTGKSSKKPSWQESNFNANLTHEDALREQERLFRESAARVRSQARFQVCQNGYSARPNAMSFSQPVLDVRTRYPDHWKFMDSYARLGLPYNSPLQLVKTQYRNLARVYHPDKSGSDRTAEKFQAIAEAYHSITSTS